MSADLKDDILEPEEVVTLMDKDVILVKSSILVTSSSARIHAHKVLAPRMFFDASVQLQRFPH